MTMTTARTIAMQPRSPQMLRTMSREIQQSPLSSVILKNQADPLSFEFSW